MRARHVILAATLGTLAAPAAAATRAATPTFSPAAGTYTAPLSVAISDTTPGAKIYYTTNGSTPTTSSTLYSGPITLNATITLKAIAAATGYSNSQAASATYTLVVATPALSPVTGTYSVPQTVTISDSTPGAKIYYTTNGSTPTTSSTLYTGPITLTATTTVQAIAAATGCTNSAVASAAYTLVVPTPTFSPAAGTYLSPQTVTISDATRGATIFYSLDGSTPITWYQTPFTVSEPTTVKAIATYPGCSDSAIGTATYTVTPPAPAPTLSPLPGSYPGPLNLTLSDWAPGAQIFYTLDGSPPTTSSTLYSGPIPLAAGANVQAFALAPGYSASPVVGGTYSVSGSSPEGIATEFTITATNLTPTYASLRFSTSGTNVLLLLFVSLDGPSSALQSVSLSGSIAWNPLQLANSQPGAAGIWWASAPSPLTDATVYIASAPFPNSGYRLMGTVVALEGAHLPPGSSGAFSGPTGAPSLTLTSTLPGSWFYAVGFDKTSATARTPGPNQTIVSENGDIYSAIDGWVQMLATPAVAAGTSITLNVAAPAAERWNFAGVEIVPAILPPPTFSPPAGTYDKPQAVTILATYPGAQVRYSIDGSTPTTTSPLYTGPISVGTSSTVKAIATAAGFSTSAVASATYAIVPVVRSIAVQAPAAVLAVGSSQQCTATATYSDGSVRDLTSAATWASSDPSVASIASSGSMTALRGGIATVTASIGTVSGDFMVTVPSAPPIQTAASTYYCFDGAGNVTAMLSCPANQTCEDQCP
jgi:hypothetical protein